MNQVLLSIQLRLLTSFLGAFLVFQGTDDLTHICIHFCADYCRVTGIKKIPFDTVVILKLFHIAVCVNLIDHNEIRIRTKIQRQDTAPSIDFNS